MGIAEIIITTPYLIYLQAEHVNSFSPINSAFTGLEQTISSYLLEEYTAGTVCQYGVACICHETVTEVAGTGSDCCSHLRGAKEPNEPVRSTGSQGALETF